MIVNGKEMDLPSGITVTELLEQLNLSQNSIVVAISLVVVPKEKYSSTILNQEDQVEIIRLVGGG
ncbi:MAG: sulfur carrier protein ThiS [Syntrophomonas sp.]